MERTKDLYTRIGEALEAQSYPEIIRYLSSIIPDQETRPLVLWEAVKVLGERNGAKSDQAN